LDEVGVIPGRKRLRVSLDLEHPILVNILQLLENVFAGVIATIVCACAVILFRNIKKTGQEERKPHLSTIRLINGFGLAILAGLIWGLGNAVTRYTTIDYPHASFDISFVKYIMAGLFLLCFGFFWDKTKRSKVSLYAAGNVFRGYRSYIAMTAKAADSYLWIYSTAFISAGLAASLENLHIAWSLLFAVIILRQNIVVTWLFPTLPILIGVALIFNLGDIYTGGSFYFGVLLAFLSGLCFTVFSIVWSTVGHKSVSLSVRCVEMGLFMIIATAILYPIHILIQFLSKGGAFMPFEGVPLAHIAIQGVSGFFGLGITYLLVNESLRQFRDAGPVASLAMGLGLSFSVMFTMVTEQFLFSSSISSAQWLGLVLFGVGYASIFSFLASPKLRLINERN